MQKEISIKVSGQVQGVFFRWETMRLARRLGLAGWVSNESDGTVKIVAQGAEDKLKEFIERLRWGPKYARVENIETNWSQPKENFADFRIRY